MQLPFEPRRDMKRIFSTPLAIFEVPGAAELTPRIAEVVLGREKADTGVNRSNRGGWHSDDKMLLWPELEFADLGDTFRSAVSHMIAITSGKPRFNVDLSLGAWANVNRAGSFNSPHIHPENHWSGVFYVQTADFSSDPIKNAGDIEFQDPRGAVCMLPTPGQSDVLSIKPIQGTIIVFPSWLYHRVSMFSIDVVRISIAFNARINKFQAIEG